MAQVMELADELGSLALFADLTHPQLDGAAHAFEEVWFGEGERILRQDLTGSGFYVILDGEVAVRSGEREAAVLGRGDFFGEVSALLGELPSADVVALHQMRCLHLPAAALHEFLVTHPAVMYRMLLDQTRRLRATTRALG